MAHSVGYVNLCLAILTDAATCKHCKLWRDFIKVFNIKRRHHDPLDVAMWVGDWLTYNITEGD